MAVEIIDDCLVAPLAFNTELSHKFYLLVDSLSYDCVDEISSDFQKFLENDPVRPDVVADIVLFLLIIGASKQTVLIKV